MMFDFAPDPVFPALATLNRADLLRITGAEEVELLRTRHQPGTRAVLHVAFHRSGSREEGVIWFLWPEKIDRLRQSHPDLCPDPATGAVFEPFPHDHRMPELARFMADRAALAPRLLDAPTAEDPVLLRYRPGLSATFRWQATDGPPQFVKVARKASVLEQAAIVTALADQLEGSALSVARVAGIAESHAAICYRGAEGTPFDKVIDACALATVAETTGRLVSAMVELWTCRIDTLPRLDKNDYLLRARRSVEIIAAADPEAGQLAQSRLNRATAMEPVLRHCPIHTDMKPDHAFMGPSGTTLIDTESLHLGDPDYDLAMLDARLDIAVLEGRLDNGRCRLIRQVLRWAGGAEYDWFLSLATLHTAKYFAQRPNPERAQVLHTLLRA